MESTGDTLNPSQPSQSHQLAAIMFTDIAGYTALMGEDEEKAFELLKKNRLVQRPIIERYNGRWLKEIGDGVLASFNAVSDAVYCAGAIQKACENESGLRLRIGIHEGEVVFEGDDVFGDGVNIASRLEPLAPIGGILVSESVSRNIENKKGIKTKFLQEVTLKNVKHPVKIYQVEVDGIEAPEPVTATTAPLDVKPQEPKSISSRKVGLTALAVIIVLVLAYFFYSQQGEGETQPVQTEVIDRSIAVLPFKNISEGKESQYFADGVMEAVLNHLSKVKDLRVISRTSMEQYRETLKTTTQIAEELGVAHLLEGSAQQYGNKVRITVQLINAQQDQHLWSESYDRELLDIFAIQTEIAQSIGRELKAKLTSQERQLIEVIPTSNLKAYDFYLRGREHHHRWQFSHTEEDFEDALSLYRQSLNVDPEFALPYMEMGWFYWWKFFFAVQTNYLDSVLIYANKTIDKDPTQSEGYALKGLYFFTIKDKENALKELKKAIELKPNSSTALRWLGFLYFMEFNDYEKAFVNYKKSEKLEYGWEESLLYMRLGEFYLYVGDYEKAEVYFEKFSKLWPDPMMRWWLGWLATIQGEFEEALIIYQQILSIYPDDYGMNILMANNMAYLMRFQEAEEYWKKATDSLQDPIRDPYRDMRIYGYTLSMNDKEDEAERLFNEQISLCLDSIRLDRPYKENAYFDLAATYAFLGNKEEAYKWLGEQERIGFSFVLFPEKLGFVIGGLEDLMLHDPMFESLWDDQEFKEIIERVHTEKADKRARLVELEKEIL